VGVQNASHVRTGVSYNVTNGAESRTWPGNASADPLAMRVVHVIVPALALALGFSPAPSHAQAAAHVDVSVTVLPAPTYVTASSQPSGMDLGLRIVGAATCAVVAVVGATAESLGPCAAVGGVGEATWARLTRAAATRPVRILLTIDAGT
jgi:hypothetical protein